MKMQSLLMISSLILSNASLAAVDFTAGTSVTCATNETLVPYLQVKKDPKLGCYQNEDLTAVYNGYEFCLSNVSGVALEDQKTYEACVAVEREQLVVIKAQAR